MSVVLEWGGSIVRLGSLRRRGRLWCESLAVMKHVSLIALSRAMRKQCESTGLRIEGGRAGLVRGAVGTETWSLLAAQRCAVQAIPSACEGPLPRRTFEERLPHHGVDSAFVSRRLLDGGDGFGDVGMFSRDRPSFRGLLRAGCLVTRASAPPPRHAGTADKAKKTGGRQGIGGNILTHLYLRKRAMAGVVEE